MELKRVFRISSSETEDSGKDPENVARGNPIKIRLNPKVETLVVLLSRRSRPLLETELTGNGCKVSGEVSLKGLLAALDREQPELVVAHRRLAGVIVKYGKADSIKLKYKVMKNPVLILDPFYVLPSKLLDACMKTNAIADAIVKTEASTLPVKRFRNDASTETILIKDVGNYSREQILKAAVQLGLDTHEKLVEEELPSLSAEYHSKAREIADKLIRAIPKKQIQAPPSTVLLRIAVHREANNVA
ncbi:LOW QUALITY PROTEIN: hypothetical protein PHMEG_00018251 [Phytophthora megakarya]|uniref:Uncharacterized protein n=1 Tax=Phytophthora megakarya TaxID=4795 RepID=A0A225VU87_9STRA|nr:LOW QUALITY PROTEIN: hypothetical protein PHMEG_00018251 [Phytophthora megakarya]